MEQAEQAFNNRDEVKPSNLNNQLKPQRSAFNVALNARGKKITGASAIWFSWRSSELGKRNVSRWLCEFCSVCPLSSNLRYRDMVAEDWMQGAVEDNSPPLLAWPMSSQ